jgi:MoxR-like ATPase
MLGSENPVRERYNFIIRSSRQAKTNHAMTEPLLVAKSKTAQLRLLPALANRHGLIAGATGTGKTATLHRLAQGFSRGGKRR